MSNSALVFALSALKKANTALDEIANLPEPMIFKGTLGTGGTIETLPSPSDSNKGFVYIVITDGTYAGQSASAGDMFISNATEWVLVPSGDDSTSVLMSQTLTAGQTSLTFTNAAITADSAFSYWTSIQEGAFGISPTNAVASTGSLVLTFPAQATDMIVKVEVK